MDFFIIESIKCLNGRFVTFKFITCLKDGFGAIESKLNLNFWDETWRFLSFGVFRLLSSLLYLQRFGRCAFLPSSRVSWQNWEFTWNLPSNALFKLWVWYYAGPITKCDTIFCTAWALILSTVPNVVIWWSRHQM